MATLYLVRHGETAYTEQGLFCGALDPPLSLRGKESAALVAAKLKDITFDRAVCSPKRRCQMTMEAFGRPYSIDEELVELDFGEFEGKSYAGLYNEKGAAPEEYFKNWTSFTFPDGNCVPDYYWQAAGKLKSMLEEWEGTVLAVSHAGFMGAAIGGLLLGDVSHMFDLRIRPCECIKVWKEDNAYRYCKL